MKNNHGPRLWSRKTNTRAAMVLMIEDRPGRNGLKNALPIGGAFLLRVIMPEKTQCRTGARVFTAQDRRDMLQDTRAACLFTRPRVVSCRVSCTGYRDRIPGAVCVFPGPVPGYLLPIGACTIGRGACFNPGPLRRDYCSIPGPHAARGCSSRRRDRVTAAGLAPGRELFQGRKCH